MNIEDYETELYSLRIRDYSGETMEFDFWREKWTPKTQDEFLEDVKAIALELAKDVIFGKCKDLCKRGSFAEKYPVTFHIDDIATDDRFFEEMEKVGYERREPEKPKEVARLDASFPIFEARSKKCIFPIVDYSGETPEGGYENIEFRKELTAKIGEITMPIKD